MIPATITLTTGPKNARTDPETGLRFYTWKGKEYPSASSIRRMAGLPFNLHQWTLSKVIERAVTEFPLMTAMMTRPVRPRERVRDKNVAKEVGKWLRSAATEERDEAADLGKLVHDLAMTGAEPATAPFETQMYLLQYRNWLTTSGVKVLAFEKQCFNLTIGYAGTFDLLVEYPDGTVGVLDLKTGRGTWPEHAIQLVGYALAEFVGEDDVVDPVLTDALHSASRMALLHLGPDGWVEQQIEATPELFTAFKSVLGFSTWLFKYKTIDGLVATQTEGSV